MVTTTLVGFALGLTVLVLYGFRKYQNVINPLSITLLFDGGLKVLLGCGVLLFLGLDQYSDDVIEHTLLLSCVHLGAFSAAFVLFGRSRLDRFAAAGLRMFGLQSESQGVYPVTVGALTLLLIATFAALAVLGGGGILWFSDPRSAYQGFRQGAGPFYLLAVWTITFLNAYCLFFARRASTRSLLLAAVLALSFFTGSKQVLIVNLFLVFFYYGHYVARITPVKFSILGAGSLAMFGLMQYVQGTAADVLGAISYFDYFINTVMYIDISDQIGPLWGGGYASSLWGYAPRLLFSEKPFIYGQLLVQDILYPGAAEQAFTPGFLNWMLAHVDFGAAGVFVSGLVSGLFCRAAYENFLRRKGDFFAFLLAAQVTITLYMVPLHGEMYLLFWFIVQKLILSARLRLIPLRTAGGSGTAS